MSLGLSLVKSDDMLPHSPGEAPTLQARRPATFRVEAKAAGGIISGYDALSDAGLIAWLKREDKSGWYLFLTAAGRAAVDDKGVRWQTPPAAN